VAGLRTVPLGVYDELPPEDLPGVKSIGVGNSRTAKFARLLTDTADELGDFLDRINPLP
jgi:hypothetical protein